VFELAAVVMAFYYRVKWRDTVWRFFPYFLLVTLVTELTAKYMHYQPSLKAYHFMVYRYVNVPATILFCLWIAHRSFNDQSMRKWITMAALLYVCAWLLEEFLGGLSFRKSSMVSYGVGFGLLLVMAVVWLTKLVRANEILSFKQNMYFWFYAGLLVFYIITLPFNELRIAINEQYPELVWAFWYLSMFFNYIMYTFFIIGIKWAEPKSSYSL
jgi:hypothetical protein